MLRALFWKEWREQRSLVAAGGAVSLLVPLVLLVASVAIDRAMPVSLLAESVMVVTIGVVWPLFAAGSGAGTMGSDADDGTLGYLLSRPASRLKVWGVKVAAGLAAFLVVVGISLGVVAALRLVGGNVGVGTTGLILRRGPGGAWGTSLELVSPVVLGLLPLSILLLFPFAVLLSTFRMRALAAAGWSGALTVVTLLGLQGLQARIGMWDPSVFVGVPDVDVLLVAGVLLLASLLRFTHGEPLEAGARRGILLAVAVAGVGILLGVLPTAWSYATLAPVDGVESEFDLASGRDSLVVRTSGVLRNGGHLWWAPADGSGPRRLTGRLQVAAAPSVSPDGRWVAYYADDGPLGLLSTRPGLRVRRLHADVERTLLRGLFPDAHVHGRDSASRSRRGFSSVAGRRPAGVFSPTSTHLALATRELAASEGWTLHVVGFETGDVRSLGLEEIGVRSTVRSRRPALRWSSDGRRLYLLLRRDYRESEGRLVAYDMEAGSFETVLEEPGWVLGWPDHPEPVSRWMILRATPAWDAVALPLDGYAEIVRFDEPDEDVSHLQLVDLVDGSARVLSESRLDIASMGSSGRRLFHAVVSRDPEAPEVAGRRTYRTRLEIVSPERRERRVVTSFAGAAAEMFPPPPGGRHVAMLVSASERGFYGLIDLDDAKPTPRELRRLPVGWRVRGWLGPEALLVSRQPASRGDRRSGPGTGGPGGLGGAGDRVLAVFDAVDETLRQIYPRSHDEADLEQPTSGER